MPPSQQIKKLSIRIPELELRRIKSLAALRGVSLQQAVRLALEAWASPPEKAFDAEKPERQASAAKRTPARRRDANAGPSANLSRGQPHDLDGAALAWFRKVGTLDWSKCSAVEGVPTKDGIVRVVRGTRVPVPAIFRSLAQGHEFAEIAGALGLTHEQLKAVLQFAAEGGMFPRFHSVIATNGSDILPFSLPCPGASTRWVFPLTGALGEADGELVTMGSRRDEKP